MNTLHNLFDSLKEFDLGQGKSGRLLFAPCPGKGRRRRNFQTAGLDRLVLESVLRNCDGKKVSENNVRELTQWQPKTARTQEIPFIVARIVLQDLTGVPLLVDQSVVLILILPGLQSRIPLVSVISCTRKDIR